MAPPAPLQDDAAVLNKRNEFTEWAQLALLVALAAAIVLYVGLAR